jgi:hypothetical protein
MSAISIVINAVNNAKAAFTSVGNQVVELNKKLNKAAGVMKSLFAVGIAARFVKGLVDASSQSEKLEGIVGRIKSTFGSAATTIGDGLVDILGILEPLIVAAGNAINKVIDGVKLAAGIVGALFEGKGIGEAIDIAQTSLAAEKAEQQVRIAAQKTADEKQKLQEETASNAIKEEQRVAKEREKLAQEIAKLENDIADQQTKIAESQMSDAEILAKRKQEAEKAYNDYVTALLEGRRKDELEAYNEFLKLQEEIMKMESDIAEEAKKTSEELEKQVKSKQAQAEADKLKEIAQKGETAALEKINELEAQRVQLLERQAELIKISEESRNRATDRNYRKQAKEREKEEAKEQRRYDTLLENAKRIQEENAKGGLQRGMSEAERLALESEQAKIGAGVAGRQAEAVQNEISNIQQRMADSLKAIEEKITEVLAYK